MHCGWNVSDEVGFEFECPDMCLREVFARSWEPAGYAEVSEMVQVFSPTDSPVAARHCER